MFRLLKGKRTSHRFHYAATLTFIRVGLPARSIRTITQSHPYAWLLVAILLLACLPAAPLGAQGGPDVINFQGRLLDASGDPRGGETHCMRFRLCSDESCASPRWGYEYHEVTTESGPYKAGLFTVSLGSVSPIPPTLLFDYDSLWVEQGVSDAGSSCGSASYTSLSPNSPLRAVAYAQRARRVRTEESDDTYLVDVRNSGSGGSVYASTASGVAGTAAGYFHATGAGSGNTYGVYAKSDSSNLFSMGVYAQGQIGAWAAGKTIGMWASADDSGTGIVAGTPSGTGAAGHYVGNVDITGTLAKGGGSFKIDHPLDPANRYLQHSFVESPDMMNIYNGNVTLDDQGEAVVQLPDWFETLNMDFRYQLTPIGAPGPDLYIAEEIEDNHFKIAGGEPGIKVSWQVTGIRHDPYAEAHRIEVEMDKPENEKGKYLHPDLYGQPETMGVNYHLLPESVDFSRQSPPQP